MLIEIIRNKNQPPIHIHIVWEETDAKKYFNNLILNDFKGEKKTSKYFLKQKLVCINPTLYRGYGFQICAARCANTYAAKI